ncbi:hypothetical protein [Caldicellulosiruptor saccharolyticus]|nr:hypothetical protein [Caldicellulosiruptor saccharolyticus]
MLEVGESMENKKSYFSWIAAGCITSTLIVYAVNYLKEFSYFKENPLNRIIQLSIVVGIAVGAIIDAKCTENSDRIYLRILLNNFLLFFTFFFLPLNIGLFVLKIIPSIKDLVVFVLFEIIFTYSVLRSNYLYILKFKKYKNYGKIVILFGLLIGISAGIIFPEIEGMYRYLLMFVFATIFFEVLNFILK